MSDDNVIVVLNPASLHCVYLPGIGETAIVPKVETAAVVVKNL